MLDDMVLSLKRTQTHTVTHKNMGGVRLFFGSS